MQGDLGFDPTKIPEKGMATTQLLCLREPFSGWREPLRPQTMGLQRNDMGNALSTVKIPETSILLIHIQILSL